MSTANTTNNKDEHLTRAATKTFPSVSAVDGQTVICPAAAALHVHVHSVIYGCIPSVCCVYEAVTAVMEVGAAVFNDNVTACNQLEPSARLVRAPAFLSRALLYRTNRIVT